ncbi:MAG: hypothetical protein KBF76_10535 [Verrucomicrobiales bacterium]|jgi:hypothetical protein|nr:hypothetical protein [Verrucomicrobiales bacterium]
MIEGTRLMAKTMSRPSRDEYLNGVLCISASQIDRGLEPKKIGRGKINPRTPKISTASEAVGPIRAECWNATEPG